MNNYCTLFDSGYLTRGLCMYNSILKTGEDFRLFVFAFDDECFEILEKLSLPNLVPISLKMFESERLLKIKTTRTRGEYCWTCSCFSILHVITHYEVEEVTYLDSDLFFYNRPEILLKEFHESGKDVLITRHRYTPIYDQTRTSGIYCVQFMTFKNNKNGLEVLNWWCDRCEEWCYNRFEDGKFGDQKYLDDWMDRFTCCHELEHLGGGVAPWNVQQYKVQSGPKVNGIDVVFYHFHALKWLGLGKAELSNYKLSPSIKKHLYIPYMKALRDSLDYVRKHYDKDFSKGFYSYPKGLKSLCRRTIVSLKCVIKGRYNVCNF